MSKMLGVMSLHVDLCTCNTIKQTLRYLSLSYWKSIGGGSWPFPFLVWHQLYSNCIVFYQTIRPKLYGGIKVEKSRPWPLSSSANFFLCMKTAHTRRLFPCDMAHICNKRSWMRSQPFWRKFYWRWQTYWKKGKQVLFTPMLLVGTWCN